MKEIKLSEIIKAKVAYLDIIQELLESLDSKMESCNANEESYKECIETSQKEGREPSHWDIKAIEECMNRKKAIEQIRAIFEKNI